MDEPVRFRHDDDGTLDIVLTGAIDSINAQKVGDQLRCKIEERAPTGVRINLSSVTFLDSAGIAVLVLTKRLTRKLDLPFAVYGAGPEVFEHLRMTGLAELWDIKPAEPER